MKNESLSVMAAAAKVSKLAKLGVKASVVPTAKGFRVNILLPATSLKQRYWKERESIQDLETSDHNETRRFGREAFALLRDAEEIGERELMAQLRRSKRARSMFAKFESGKPGRPTYAQAMAALKK